MKIVELRIKLFGVFDEFQTQYVTIRAGCGPVGPSFLISKCESFGSSCHYVEMELLISKYKSDMQSHRKTIPFLAMISLWYMIAYSFGFLSIYSTRNSRKTSFFLDEDRENDIGRRRVCHISLFC
jgi:hypothetical protein